MSLAACLPWARYLPLASAVPVLSVARLRLAADLNNPTAVATVLSQEPGKLRAAELRGTVDSLGYLAQRQRREAAFLQVVRERQAEEQAS